MTFLDQTKPKYKKASVGNQTEKNGLESFCCNLY